MGLACPRIADEHDRLGAFDVAALGQLAHPRRRDHRRLAEVELVQRFDARQVRVFDATIDRAPLTLLELGRQQCFEVAEIGLAFAFGLLGQRSALAGQGRQTQQHALLLDDALPQAQLTVHRPGAHRAAPTSRSS